MNKFSIKRLKAERNLRRIERILDKKPENQRCFFYASERRNCMHHIIPKSEGLKWIDMEENLLPVGRTAHAILHNGCNSEIRALPRFKEYLRMMNWLNDNYYNRYLLKLSK